MHDETSGHLNERQDQVSLKNWPHNTFQIEKDLFYH